MLHVIDNLLPANALQDLRDLCDIHGRLKQQHDGDTQFSWRPETGSPRSIHAAAQQTVVDRYLDEEKLYTDVKGEWEAVWSGRDEGVNPTSTPNIYHHFSLLTISGPPNGLGVPSLSLFPLHVSRTM